MANRRKSAAAPTAAALSPDAPHWQVARVAQPGEVFTETDIRDVTTTVVADARGVVVPRSIAENRLVDHLPAASAELLAAPIPDELTSDDAGEDAGEED